MPDLATINIPVNTREINQAIRDSERLDTTLKKLRNSAKLGKIDDGQFRQGLTEIKRAYAQAFGVSIQKANADIKRLNTALDTQAAKADRAAQAQQRLADAIEASAVAARNQSAFNSVLGVGGQPATSAGAGFSALEAEMDRLALKYNSVYAASRLYESQLNELNRAEQLGVIALNQYETQLESLNMEFQQFQNGTAGAANRFMQLNYAAQASRKGFAQFGMVAQQTGYQVGDFIVQIQSGTNAWVAAGQQLTQLAGLLFLIPGAMGAIAGVAASILIPLATAIGGYFSRTKEAKEETDRFDEAIKAATQTAKEYGDVVNQITYGGMDATEGSFLKRLEEESKLLDELIQKQKELNDNVNVRGRNLKARSDNIKQEIADQEEVLRKLNSQLDTYTFQRDVIKEINGLTKSQINDKQTELDTLLKTNELIRANVDEEIAKLIATKQVQLEKLNVLDQQISQQLNLNQITQEEAEERRRILDAQRDNIKAAYDLDRAILKAKDSTSEMNSVAESVLATMLEAARVNLAGVFDQAITSANGLLGVVRQIAAETPGAIGGALEQGKGFLSKAGDFLAKQAQQGFVQIGDRQWNPLGTSAPINSPRPRAAPVEGVAPWTIPDRSGGGGGGGSSASQVDNIAQLEREIQLKQTLATLNKEEREFFELKESIRERLGDQAERLTEAEIDQYARRMQAAEESLQRQIEMEEQLQRAREWAADAMTDLWMAAFEGGEKFRQTLARIILDLARMAAQKAFQQMFSGAFGGGGGGFFAGLFGSANGNVFNAGRVMAFANGGVVGGPTTFPMTDGRTGLMGEAGPEAIMPLRRGQDGKLGVEASAPVVNQKIINVLDPSIVGDYLATSDGERVVMNVLRKNGVTGR